MWVIGRITKARAIGTTARNGFGYPGIGATIIDGFVGIMSAVASGIASMPGSIITTMTTITIPIAIRTQSQWWRK